MEQIQQSAHDCCCRATIVHQCGTYKEEGEKGRADRGSIYPEQLSDKCTCIHQHRYLRGASFLNA